jgi:hypothetical protein
MNHSRVEKIRAEPLSETEIAEVRHLYRPGEVGYLALARKFEVSQRDIRKALKDVPRVWTTPQCPTGKQSYSLQALAASAAGYLNQRKAACKQMVWPYRCPRCKTWHVGRMRVVPQAKSEAATSEPT